MSPAPYIGYAAIEAGQKWYTNVDAEDKPVDLSQDPEAWSFHPKGFADFIQALGRANRRKFIILSGDVHYGFTANANCAVHTASGSKTFSIVQFVSSALKNASSTLQAAKSIAPILVTQFRDDFLLGHMDKDRYRLKTLRELRGSPDPYPGNWELQIQWSYSFMGGVDVVEDNNVGYLKISNAEANQTLYTRATSFTAGIRWADIPLKKPLPLPKI